MKIGIVGLGFVGLSLTSVLASGGYRTIGIDIDKKRCEKISNGNSPFFEPGLEKTLRNGLKKKLTISNDFSLLNDCDFIFVAVGTPQSANGTIDLSMIKKSIRSVGKTLHKNNKNPIILVKSTVVPGTMKNTILPIGGVDSAEQVFLNKRYFRELKLFYFGIPVFLRASFFLDTPLPSCFRIGSLSWVQAAFL